MASLGVRDKIWWRKRAGLTDKEGGVLVPKIDNGYCAFYKVGVGKDEHFESLCGYFEVKKLSDLRPRVHSQQVCRPCLADRCFVCNDMEMKQRKSKNPLPPSLGREP